MEQPRRPESMRWHDLGAPPRALRLAPTLLSGMSFRWWYRAESSSFVGVLGSTIFELQETHSTTLFRQCNELKSSVSHGDAESIIRAHLSLDRGPSSVAWSDDDGLPKQYQQAAKALPGVRVVSHARMQTRHKVEQDSV